MSRLMTAFALALLCGLCGCSSVMTSAPTRAPAAGPLNAAPNECVTDEGYGRWSPCGNKS